MGQHPFRAEMFSGGIADVNATQWRTLTDDFLPTTMAALRHWLKS
jgi:hypothetical protein